MHNTSKLILDNEVQLTKEQQRKQCHNKFPLTLFKVNDLVLVKVHKLSCAIDKKYI